MIRRGHLDVQGPRLSPSVLSSSARLENCECSRICQTGIASTAEVSKEKTTVRCDLRGNDYDKAFTITAAGRQQMAAKRKIYGEVNTRQFRVGRSE
jgi:hypothetical protein